MMDKDRLAGSAKQAKGSVKEAIGKVTGDTKTQATGAADKAAGEAQSMIGEVGRRRAPYLAAFGLPSFLPLIDPARPHFSEFAGRDTGGDGFVSAACNDPPPTEVVASPGAAVAGASRTRVSWSAIFAGIVLVLAIQVLLDLLGAGIGLGLIHPGSSPTPGATSFGVAAGIWWLVSAIIAFVFGCYAAARLAGVASRWDGVLHGLVIWGGAVLITIYLLTTAIGGLIGGAFSVLGGTVSAAGSIAGGTASAAGKAVKAVLPQVEQATSTTPNVLQQQAESILRSPTPQAPANMSHADAVKAIGQAFPDLLSGGSKAAAAQKRITDIVAAQANISPQDAQKRVADAKARLVSLKNQAVQAAEQTANASAAAASHTALLAFVALIIGAIAAGIGGALASPQRPPFLARWIVRSPQKV